MCLQEVDPFYFPFLLDELDRLGYHGVYKEHDSTHGLATFYNRVKFEMTSSETHGFTELLGELNDSDSQFKESNRHNQRYAQYTTLKDLQTGMEVIIGWSCITKPCRGGKISSFLQPAFKISHFHQTNQNPFCRYKYQPPSTPSHCEMKDNTRLKLIA